MKQKNEFESQLSNQREKYEKQILDQEKLIQTKLVKQENKFKEQLSNQQAEYERQLLDQQKSYESKLKKVKSEHNKKYSEQQKQVEILNHEHQELQSQINELKKKNANIQRNQSDGQIKFKDFEIINRDTIHELEIYDEISKNKFCTVSKVGKKEIYALKTMNSENATTDDLKNFMKGYEIINMLNHPNIIKTYGIFIPDQSNESPSILLEYCSKNLPNVIKEKSLSNIKISFSIYQITEGMKYLHSQKVLHRNLKPTNILISKEGIIKISDFSTAKIMMTEEDFQMTLRKEKQTFTAPEMMTDENYDEKVDVYSFGILVFYILNDGKLPEMTFKQLMKRNKPTIPSEFNEFARRLIDECINFDPKDRPSFKTILEELKENQYEIIPLSKSEKQQVKKLVRRHEKLIPNYFDAK